MSEKKYWMAITTVMLPMIREFICAVAICLFESRQTTSFFFMYTTLIQLGYMLGARRLQSRLANWLERFNLTVVLYLSYLLLLLSDYVIDEIHYQSICNQFMYATLAMIFVNLMSILVTPVLNLVRLVRRCCYRRKLNKLLKI